MRWIAIDACHEQIKKDTFLQTLIVKDKISPTAICLDKIHLSIGANPIKLHYSDIDAAAYDVCGIMKYEVSRNQIDWDEDVEFSCEDINQIQTVYLRLTDASGNQNTCWAFIETEDKLAPICSDLADAKGICHEQAVEDFGMETDLNGNQLMEKFEWVEMDVKLENFYNTNYGSPVCSDNAYCYPIQIQQQYQLLKEACGVVHIKRRFRAVDQNGNGHQSNWSHQNIMIEYQPNWTITLPSDWIDNCNELAPNPVLSIENGKLRCARI